jgi:hypothetical protein
MDREGKGRMMNLGVLETLFDICIPIRKCACHHTTEDEVKLKREGPFFF